MTDTSPSAFHFFLLSVDRSRLMSSITASILHCEAHEFMVVFIHSRHAEPYVIEDPLKPAPGGARCEPHHFFFVSMIKMFDSETQAESQCSLNPKPLTPKT